MLSDEEKAVLKTAKENYGLTSAEQKILVNLIEKQSKEIEELKNEVMEKELIIDGMKEDRRIAVEEIQEQYYVSKDKIKEKNKKIENELEKHIKFCEQEAEGSLNNEICHISLKFNKRLLDIINEEE